jgi:hypothetical protein
MQISERGCFDFRVPPFEMEVARGMSGKVKAEMQEVEQGQQMAISEDVLDQPSHGLKLPQVC